MTVVHNIAKNSIFRAIIESAKLVSGVVLVIVLARLLGPTEYGRLSFVLALVTFFSVGINLGLPLTFVREGARREGFLRENLVTGLALQLAASLTLLIVIAGALYAFPGESQDRVLIITAMIYAYLSVTTNYLFSFFQAVQKMQLEAFSVAFQNILTLVTVLIMLVWRSTSEVAMLGYGLAGLISFIQTLYFVRRYLFSWRWEASWARAKKVLSSSWPLLASLAFGAIYNSLDTVMLKALRGNEVVGIYSAQYRVVYAFYIFGGWYIYSVFPVLSSFFVTEKKKFGYLMQRAIQHMASFAVVFGLIITFFAPAIVTLLYGDSYTLGVSTLQILIWSAMVSMIGTVFYHSLIAAEKQKQALTSVIISTTVVVISNLITIPRYGMVGAAFSTVLAQAVQLLLNYKAINKSVRINFFGLIAKPVVYALISSLVFILLRQFAGLYLSGVVAILLLVALLIRGGVFQLSEVKELYGSLLKRPTKDDSLPVNKLD